MLCLIVMFGMAVPLSASADEGPVRYKINADTLGASAPAADTAADFEEADFGEAEADFDEAVADFGEGEADFGDDTEGSAGQAAFTIFSAPAQAVVKHTALFVEPSFFAERQPRTIASVPYYWAVAIVLLICMVPMVAGQGVKRDKKQARVHKNIKAARRVTIPVQSSQLTGIIVLLGLMFLLIPGQAQALQYSSVKDGVTNALGKGNKILQQKITITPDAEKYLKDSLGWTPSKKLYKAYFSKGADGKPQRYAFVLQQPLALCGGLHKYCVAINADGKMHDVSILELTCDRSYCINSKSFLAQFKKFDINNQAQKAKNYDAMAGATLSTDLTRDIVQRAFALMNIMNGKYHAKK